MISDDEIKCFYSRWVRASYGVASAYVLADTADKGQKMNKVRRLEWSLPSISTAVLM